MIPVCIDNVLIAFAGITRSIRDNCTGLLFSLFGWSLTMLYRFDENYGLASTQSLKNKDIPEGGAKGTILPSYVHCSTRVNHCLIFCRLGAPPRLCFEKYVDVGPLLNLHV